MRAVRRLGDSPLTLMDLEDFIREILEHDDDMDMKADSS